ncbi:hypothetical protein Q5752_005182 [Cryptotrichosporon argae]
MPGALILINGFPGVGKHTVGHELTKHLPNCKFFDTRNLVGAASQLYSPDDPAHSLLRKNLKHAIFQSIAQSNPRVTTPTTPTAPAPPTYVLTDFLSVSARPSDRAIMHEFIAFARAAGFVFVHIILSCSTAANVARLSSPARRDAAQAYAHTRLVDEQRLVEMRMEEEIGHLGNVHGLAGEFELDTTDMDAQTAGSALAEYCLDTLRRAGWYIQLEPKVRAGRLLSG